ncbi:MAG: hypothetical protein WCJ30_23640, partial [Deltaproteobacteria bacterium]
MRHTTPRRSTPAKLAVIVTLALVCGTASAQPPDWAYPGCSKRATVNDGSEAVGVPGAAVSMLPARIRAPADPPDWFPDEHSPAPPVVMVGATPTTYACGYCHLVDGHGRPENAKLAGLPADYILRQLRALRSAERREGLAGWLPTQLMITLATNLTDADAHAAAEYFAKQHARASVRVVEAADVPPHAATCYVNEASA